MATTERGNNVAEKVVIGNAELWHGDCREVLPLLREADCVITDPPYNIGAAEWDTELPLWALPLIAETLKDGGACYWFGMAPHVWRVGLDGALDFHRELIWDHSTGYPAANNYRNGTETVLFMGRGAPLYFDADAIREEYAMRPERPNGRPERQNPLGKSPGNVFRYPRPAPRHADETLHPHAKPVAMLERFVLASCPPSGTVVDAFMGSASVAAACIAHGRRYVGIERERQWFDIACERISRAQAQGSLIPLEQTPVAEQQAMDL
jgi:site-specific DNA-methyltransferase (adenine-specific)